MSCNVTGKKGVGMHVFSWEFWGAKCEEVGQSGGNILCGEWRSSHFIKDFRAAELERMITNQIVAGNE